MGETQLGRMQFRIMQVLWDRGRASAREITDALNESEAVAHSTVQTLLRQLEAKGAVGHDAVDRTFVFFPRLKEDKVKRTAAREMLDRIFGRQRGKPGRPSAQGRAIVPGRARRTSPADRPTSKELREARQ